MNSRCNSGECISVLLADSDLIRRQLLTRELQRSSRFELACCSNDLTDCRRVLDGFPADVLLWCESAQCEPKQLFSEIREIMSLRPALRCVALLAAWERELVVSAFRSGVRGLFSLDQGSVDELRKCILCVYRNQVWANSSQVLLLIEAFRRAPVVRIMNFKGKNLLTPRQQELVELVAEGMGNREVAHHLNITENTVKKSLLRIFDKVGVSNRVELVLAALAFKNLQIDGGVRVPPAKARIETGDLFRGDGESVIQNR